MPFKLNVKCPTRAPLVSSQHRTAPSRAAGPRRPPAPGSPSTRKDSRSTTTSPTRNSSSCVSYHPRPLSDSSMSAPHQSDGSMKSVAIMTRPFNSRHTTTISLAAPDEQRFTVQDSCATGDKNGRVEIYFDTRDVDILPIKDFRAFDIGDKSKKFGFTIEPVCFHG